MQLRLALDLLDNRLDHGLGRCHSLVGATQLEHGRGLLRVRLWVHVNVRARLEADLVDRRTRATEHPSNSARRQHEDLGIVPLFLVLKQLQ